MSEQTETTSTAATGIKNFRPGSFASQIAALKPGEMTSKVQSVDTGLTLDEYARTSHAMREKLRSVCNSTARQVRGSADRADATYTVEVGEMMTVGRVMYLVAIITRVGVAEHVEEVADEL